MAGDHRKPTEPNGMGERRDGLAGTLLAVAARSSGRRRILLLACLCVAIAGVSVAVISAAGRHDHPVAGVGATQAASQPGPGQPPTNAPSPASTGQDTAGGPASAGGKANGPHLPPRLRRLTLRWEAGRGGRALATVEQHIGIAMQSAGLRLYNDMRTMCLTLTSDVGAARAAPPIPDAARQRQYAKALTGIAGAAADCRGAISIRSSGDETVEIHVNKALLSRSRRELAAMSRQLYLATRDIRLVSV